MSLAFTAANPVLDFYRRLIGASGQEGSYWGNVGNSYVKDWNDLTKFAADPVQGVQDFFNPPPVVHEFEGAKEARETAGKRIDPSQNAFMDMMNQGSQRVSDMQAAQMQAAQMQAAGVDPTAFLRSWQDSQGGLFNTAFGATSPYAQAMNQVAQRQAALGGEAALGAMPGARNSGAGMAAFGQAYSDPFAQAQVAQQQMATDLYGNFSGQAMGQFGQNYLQNAGWQNQANQQNADWMQQANLQNAGWTQQSRLQNQAMEEAWRQRQLHAGSQYSANALGWGNIQSGLAGDLNVVTNPVSGWDVTKDLATWGIEAAKSQG